MDTYIGIDYGLGGTNIDTKTGIRYGVISQYEVLQAWADSSEPVYVYCCPYCGNGPLKKGANAKRCPNCYHRIDSENDFNYIEPVCFRYEDDGYTCEQSYDDTDIFIMESPYYTLCQYCSPCAPGAGYIMDGAKNGVKAYCFGHDWFDSGKAPYHVYEVGTGNEVLPE